MDQNPKLTLSMIVKNEERHLSNCLNSVQGVADEIVIVDTGSTDRTIEIAEKFNATILHYDWDDDFSSARNFALKNSTGNWILYLDADEQLSESSKAELNKIKEIKDLVGINCLIYNHDDIEGNPKIMKYIRVFRNHKDIRFTGRVHEQIEKSILDANYSIENSCIRIDHFGYNVSREELKKKAKRNLRSLLKEYSENPDYYNAFQLANTYSILENEEKAKYYNNIVWNSPDSLVEQKTTAAIFLVNNFMRDNRLKDAHEILKSAQNLDRNNTLLNLLSSQLYLSLGLNREAMEFCDKAFDCSTQRMKNLNLNRSFEILVDKKRIIYQGLYIALQLNNPNKLDYYLKSLGYSQKGEEQLIRQMLTVKDLKIDYTKLFEMINKNSLEFYLLLITKTQNTKTRLTIFEKLINKFLDQPKVHTNLGLVYMEEGLSEQAIKTFENALTMKEIDPSVIFFLLSIHVNEGHIDKIPGLLELALQRFSNNPRVIEKLDKIIYKIKPLLEKQKVN